MDPLSPITKIFSYVAQRERKLSVNETLTSNVSMKHNIVLSMLLAQVEIAIFVDELGILRTIRVCLIMVKHALIVVRVDILLMCVIRNMGFLQNIDYIMTSFHPPISL